jgi:hypothetical protein
LRPFSQLADLPVRESQFEEIWVAVPVGCEDHCPSIWRERAVEKVEVMVDRGVLCKLMDDCTSFVIAQALIFGWPARSFSLHSGCS